MVMAYSEILERLDQILITNMLDPEDIYSDVKKLRKDMEA